jgi:hypothetical protein
MTEDTIAVLCTAHRRRVKPGTGDVIMHDGGNVDPRCTSEQFIIRREERGGRAAVLAGWAAREVAREDGGS